MSLEALKTAFFGILVAAGTAINAQASPPTKIESTSDKQRLVVLSDIGNEPDDQMSLIRLLLYSNEIDIESIIACTST